jgi:predicted RND superfamily exporter protein
MKEKDHNETNREMMLSSENIASEGENIPNYDLKKQDATFVSNSNDLEENTNETQLSSNGTKTTFSARQAERIARYPKTYLFIGFSVSALVGLLGMILGKFSTTVDNQGWRTRGTPISLKQQQVRLLNKKKRDLFNDADGSVWEDLQENVQDGIFVTLGNEQKSGKEQEDLKKFTKEKDETKKELVGENSTESSFTSMVHYNVSWYESLQTTSDLYTMNSVWKIDPYDKNPSLSALDPKVLKKICIAESNTIASLEEKGLCFGCPGRKCHQPHSLVNMIRSFVHNGIDMDCYELLQAYKPVQKDFTNVLVDCVEDIRLNWNPNSKFDTVTMCPAIFLPTVVDNDFGKNNLIIRKTISYYPTEGKDNAEEMFQIANSFDRGDHDMVLGAYDTKQKFFEDLYVLKASQTDMAMCLASASITALAIIAHTRSCWLTFVGILQIVLSFPLAYFVYRFFAGITFFPFLNFVGLFVIFAIGADDIFVAVDKWKNARKDNMYSTTEEVAAIALPNAAGAMFLTTFTTAVAFFATAICPVIPIKCFAIFLGLLVVFDYLMNVLLVFPALCMYDQWILAGKKSCCIHIERKKSGEMLSKGDQNQEKISFIHRILSGFYKIIHKARWPAVLLTMFAITICAIESAKFKLPDSARVPLFKSDNQYEQHYNWNEKLLSQTLINKAGGSALVVWGVLPADTGNFLDPKSGTTLVLDTSFSAKSPDAQSYLLNICKKIFSSDFASPTTQDFICPLNGFDNWLKSQTKRAQPDQAYIDNCSGATQIPVLESSFDQCIIAYSKEVNDIRILQNKGIVKIIYFQTELQARWNSPHSFIGEQWSKIQSWLDREKEIAPSGVGNFFFSSETFVWYDTNNNMMSTAVSASIIALTGAASVIFLSSRSFMMTLFGSISIMYVLFATIACLIGMGWELGFLESICIAILIGLSCDFVIHLGHAYTFYEGSRPRTERSKYALVHMGPSILASAATTVAAALIMLFTEISFFRKFATVLFLTILHSTIAGFIVFIVFTDTFGPAQPTKLVDQIVLKTANCFPVKQKNSGAPETERQE